MEKIYTLKQVIEMSSLNRITIYRHINEGKLKAFKVGQQWRVSETELKKYLGGE